MKKNEKKFSIKRKLLKYCELKSISKNEFYLRAGLSNGFLDKERGFNTDNLVKILNAYPDIDVHWLLFGETENPVFSGDISNNNAGGDIIANGSSKEINDEVSKAINNLSEANLVNARTIGDQSQQIGELIKYITSK